MHAWLGFIVLCAALGAIGQGARTVVGLKKAREEAEVAGLSTTDVFSAARLSVSLMIGAIAGVLAGLAAYGPDTGFDRTAALTLMAAGYAGADFIEGALSQAVPAAAQAPRQDPATPPASTPPTFG